MGMPIYEAQFPDLPSKSVLGTDSTGRVIDGTTQRAIDFTLYNPIATDVTVICQVPIAITITKITATVLGATSVTFNIDERAAASLGSAGTNTMTSSLVATTTGANTTSFTNAGIARYAFLVLVASAISGTPTQLNILIEYSLA